MKTFTSFIRNGFSLTLLLLIMTNAGTTGSSSAIINSMAPQLCSSAAVAVFDYSDPDGNMNPENATGESDENYAAIGKSEYIMLDLTGKSLPAGSTATINWRKESDQYNPYVYICLVSESGVWTLLNPLEVTTLEFSGYPVDLSAGTRYLYITNNSDHWLFVESTLTTYPCAECTDGTLTLDTGNNEQSVCQDAEINNIVYTVGGGATDAEVTGLPDGVTGNYDSGIFTISGTPIVEGTFYYTVTTTGTESPCIEATATGTITVNAPPTAPGINVKNNCGTSTLTATGYSGTLLWSTGETTASINVTSSGTYTVTQTVGGCTSIPGETTVVVEASPVATSPGLGDGSSGNPYQIATLENLYWIAANSGVWDKHFIQTADIDASATAGWCTGGWLPIGNFWVNDYTGIRVFSGSYDGQGHTISGLYIANSTSVAFGFFGRAVGATIKNLGLINVEVFDVSGDAGALVGSTNGCSIDNCYSTGSISVSFSGLLYNAGGLVGGLATNSAVSGCYSTCNVAGDGRIGGLVGWSTNYSTITNSFHATGTVNGSASTMSSTGGLVGENNFYSSIERCYSTGTVTGFDYTGGLVGVNSTNASISNCFSRGNVSSHSSFGYNSGGLVGYNYLNSTITNCFSTGLVVAHIGGLLGYQSDGATTVNSYWDTQTSGTTFSFGGTGKTTEEMQTQSTFADWDFATIWGINAGNNDGYPYLVPESLCTNGTIALTSASGSDNQTVCANTAITPIVYTISGGATGAEVSDLPDGVSGNLSSGTLTISGTPAAAGSFNYTVTTTGTTSPCIEAIATGTITVNPSFSPSVTITSSDADNKICEDTNVTFTAATANTGGGTVAYRWFLNEKSYESWSESTWSYNEWEEDGYDEVHCEITVTGGTCLVQATAVSNFIDHEVYDRYATPSVTITSSDDDNVICDDNTPVTFTAFPVNTNGGNIFYQWKYNDTSIGENQNSYTSWELEDGDKVSCQIIITEASCFTTATVASNEIVTTVISTPSVTIVSDISGDADIAICAGTSVTFTATPHNLNGGTASYTWAIYKNDEFTFVGTDQNTYTSSSLQDGDGIICGISVTGGTCPSSNSAASNVITVNVSEPPDAGVITGAVSEILAGETLQLSVTGGDISGFWATTNPDVATVSTSGLVTGSGPGTTTITYTVTGAAGCEDRSDVAEYPITVEMPTSVTFTSSGTFTVPDGVYSIDAKAWGGGGGGSGRSLTSPNYQGGAGGGGGGFRGGTLNVNPGDIITITVGTGGVGGVNTYDDGSSGTNSVVSHASGIITAYGGYGGVSYELGSIRGQGRGGLFEGTVLNQAAFKGGDAWSATGSYGVGGGGGGGAGDSSDGSMAYLHTGGAGGTASGGKGGNGSTGSEKGYNGSLNGGGGGGGCAYSTAGGGNGANGSVIISWTLSSCANATLVLSSAAGTNIQSVCDSTAISDIVYTVGGGATSTGVSGLPDGVTGNYDNGIFTISGTPSVVGAYTYTVTTTGTASPCIEATATGTITVDELPAASFAAQASNTPVCESENAEFYLTGTPNAIVSYSISDIYGSTNQTVTLNASGQATVVVSSAFKTQTMVLLNVQNPATGCSRPLTASAVVEVKPLPWAEFANPPNNGPVCWGSDARFFITGTPASRLTYSVEGWMGTELRDLDASGKTGISFADAHSNITVHLISVAYRDGMCPVDLNNSSNTVVVNSLPVVSITGPVTIPIGGETTLSPESGGTWTSSNEDVATVTDEGLVTGISVGTATFTFTDATTGCSATTMDVTIVEKTCVNGTIELTSETADQTVCAVTAITPIEYTVGGGATGASISPELPEGLLGGYDPALGTYTISGTPKIAGIFNYTVTTTGTELPCNEATANGTITVNPATEAGSVTGGTTICSGSTSGLLTLGTYTGAVVRWESSVSPFETWTPIENTADTYTSGALTATTQFRAVVQSDPCDEANSLVTTVTVNPNAAISSVTGGASPLCIGATTTCTANGVVLGGGSGEWSSSNPDVATVDQSGIVTAVGEGICKIMYVVTGCNGPAYAFQWITVDPNAAISSVTGGASPLCIGATTTCTANGVVLGGGSGAWSSSNTKVATVDKSGKVTAVGAGTCNIIYTVTGCNGPASAYQSITVNPNAAITSVKGGTTPLCIGAYTICYATGVELGGGTGAWSSSNNAVATVDQSGNVTAVGAGIANITFTITGGCAGTISAYQTITVNPNAAISSVTGGASPLCIGATTTCTANGVVLGGGTGAWSSSNPDVATVDQDGKVSTVGAGTCNIIYTVSGCNGSASAQQSITVDPSTVAGSVTGGTTICSGSTSGLLTLGTYTGAVVRWESSVSPFETWTPIENTADTYTSGPLAATTQFRAVVQSGQCDEANSLATIISVVKQPVAGEITKSPNLEIICEGTQVSATFTEGSGGVDCTDIYAYRYDGTDGEWIEYTPGSNLSTAGHRLVEISTQRGGCQIGCQTATRTASWIIDDITLPVVVTKDITVQLDADGVATILPSDVDAGSSDNCGVESMSLDITSFACVNVGTPVTVKLTVTDAKGNSAFNTAEVTVEDKIAPEIACVAGSPYTREADLNCTYYTVVGSEFDASAKDACGIGSFTYSCLTASISSGTSLSGVQLPLGDNIITWTAIDVNGNKSDCQTVVTVQKRQVFLTYTGDLTEQYSDEASLSAKLLDVTNKPVSGKAIKFTVGSQTVTTMTGFDGIATATLTLDQSPIPTYTVRAEFEGDTSCMPASDEEPFDIAQENNITAYTGNEFVGEQNPNVSTTPLVLSATVTDMDDGYRGDIRNARVQFYDVNTLAPLSDWLTPGLVVPGDLTQGSVIYFWDAPVPASGYNTFTIGVKVGTQSPEDNGYYMGSDKAVVNVYRTDLYEFISGGGHIIPSMSKGEYASDSGRKVNFGFNVKWNKTMKRLQGNLNLVFRVGDKVYQVKANAMNSLSVNSVNPCSQQAYFTSKANLTDVTLPGLPVEIKGNLNLQVTMTNNTSPGAVCSIGFTVYDGNTLIYSSSWPANQTEELPLSGGNIIVHNGITCVVNNKVDVSLSTSVNPSFVDQEVIFETVVSPKGSAMVPEGTIVFKDGTIELGTVLLSNGKASLPVSDLSEGTHAITAKFTSTNGFDDGLSNTVSQEVKTQTVNNDVSIALYSSRNPEQVRTTVTFTATVTASGTPVSLADVSFFIDGKWLITVATDGAGLAITDYAFASPGTYFVEARYAGQSAMLSQVIKNKVKPEAKSGAVAESQFEMASLNVYPNPFDDHLVFEFTSPMPVRARIDIYDLFGRLIETVYDQQIEGGTVYHAAFKPVKEVNAMYLYRVTLGNSSYVNKVVYKSRL